MTGYIYLLGSSTFGWYKIGKSRTPHVRVKDLGVLLPFKVEVIGVWQSNAYSQLEVQLHERCAEQRINGEWFRFNSEQIRELVDAMGWFAKVDSLANFKNIEKDGPAGRRIQIKLKADFDMTEEERERRKLASMAARDLRDTHDCPICGLKHRHKKVSTSESSVAGAESGINTDKPLLQ